MEDPVQKWEASASAWIALQKDGGDYSRRAILDPPMLELLGCVQGRRILDLGCGEGRFARILSQAGASVIGIDPVAEFIRHAGAPNCGAQFIVAEAGAIPLDSGFFDDVVSYLTLVDIADLEPAADEITRVLKPGGRFLAATISNLASASDGWVKDTDGNKLHRPVDRYMDCFAMDLAWSGLQIVNYHRPLGYVLGVFLRRGLVLTAFLEPLPPENDPGYAEEARCPTFQIYQFQKGGL
ncbi:MAG: methyltransferase domain-containing protein [Armatimonadetes bacterium]|nr:methyltransferase domain-containing protein [Armatimonadota bacterium]MBX3108110.1 methyltransferase domain-containing protein [Fimbriimonadaceae bacterium]